MEVGADAPGRRGNPRSRPRRCSRSRRRRARAARRRRRGTSGPRGSRSRERPPLARLELAVEQDVADHAAFAGDRSSSGKRPTPGAPPRSARGRSGRAAGSRRRRRAARPRRRRPPRTRGRLGGRSGAISACSRSWPPADVEEIGVRGTGLAEAHGPVVEADPAPGATALEHRDVAAIGVDVEIGRDRGARRVELHGRETIAACRRRLARPRCSCVPPPDHRHAADPVARRDAGRSRSGWSSSSAALARGRRSWPARSARPRGLSISARSRRSRRRSRSSPGAPPDAAAGRSGASSRSPDGSGSSGDLRAVEQTPETAFVAPALADAFPEARLVHIVRDGRDVVCSLLERGWLSGGGSGADDAGSPYGTQRALLGRARATGGVRAGQRRARRGLGLASLRPGRRAAPGRAVEVRYERSRRRPAGVAAELRGLLGVPDETVWPAALSAAHGASLGRFREELTPRPARGSASRRPARCSRELGYLQ